MSTPLIFDERFKTNHQSTSTAGDNKLTSEKKLYKESKLIALFPIEETSEVLFCENLPCSGTPTVPKKLSDALFQGIVWTDQNLLIEEDQLKKFQDMCLSQFKANPDLFTIISSGELLARSKKTAKKIQLVNMHEANIGLAAFGCNEIIKKGEILLYGGQIILFNRATDVSDSTYLFELFKTSEEMCGVDSIKYRGKSSYFTHLGSREYYLNNFKVSSNNTSPVFENFHARLFWVQDKQIIVKVLVAIKNIQPNAILGFDYGSFWDNIFMIPKPFRENGQLFPVENHIPKQVTLNVIYPINNTRLMKISGVSMDCKALQERLLHIITRIEEEQNPLVELQLSPKAILTLSIETYVNIYHTLLTGHKHPFINVHADTMLLIDSLKLLQERLEDHLGADFKKLLKKTFENLNKEPWKYSPTDACLKLMLNFNESQYKEYSSQLEKMGILSLIDFKEKEIAVAGKDVKEKRYQLCVENTKLYYLAGVFGLVTDTKGNIKDRLEWVSPFEMMKELNATQSQDPGDKKSNSSKKAH